MTEDWKQVAQDQLCRVLPPGWCQYEDGTEPTTFADTRFTRDDLLRGVTTLAEIVVTPDPFVSQELAEERGRICAACPANVQVEGCAPCVGLVGKILAIKGSAKTESDYFLKSCACCRCSNSAQVHIKADILARGVDHDHMKCLRSLPWCWKAKEIDALP